jgi:hypothetical protein
MMSNFTNYEPTAPYRNSFDALSQKGNHLISNHKTIGRTHAFPLVFPFSVLHENREIPCFQASFDYFVIN